MDILSLIGNERRYNFHSHTEFCDGRAQMQAFAAKAVELGFRHYGFSPHSPIPIESPCNMAKSKVEDYLHEVARIQELYAGSPTRFHASMEIDYLDGNWGPANDYFQSLPLDYRIGSVHFIPDQDGQYVDIDGNYESFKVKMEKHFRNDIRYVVETFYSQSSDMVDAGGFDILGHMDKVGHNASSYCPGIEEEAWYRDAALNLIDKVARSGISVELNTKAYRDHGRFFPSLRYLQELKRRGVGIIINSDAHVPALIDASRQEAFALLDSMPG